MIDCNCRFRFVWSEGRRVDATIAEGVRAIRGRRPAVWSPGGGRGLPRRAAQTVPHSSRPATEVTGRPLARGSPVYTVCMFSQFTPPRVHRSIASAVFEGLLTMPDRLDCGASSAFPT